MAWNEPGNNNNGGSDKDPWGNKNRGGRDQGPPDLDEVFGKLSRKLGGVFGGKPSSGGGKGAGAAGLGLLAAAAVVVWGLSGFYTIEQVEEGVVTRFGRYHKIAKPGLNWKPTFVDEVYPVNVLSLRALRASGLMLTSDENVINVEIGVQYRVSDPVKYLFNVTNADDSLSQATDAALRATVGDNTMEPLLAAGRQQANETITKTLKEIIQDYDMGLEIVEVTFENARPPAEVNDAFADAIKAREDQERYILEAEAYKNDILPKASGRAERIRLEADAYYETTTNEAQGEVARFERLLPEYLASPDVTRERLYLETMERVYSSTSKVLVDTSNNNNVMLMPMDSLLNRGSAANNGAATTQSNTNLGVEPEARPVVPSRTLSPNERQTTRQTGR
uniref:FtsH protease activity modulator HflK n=1 Tax=Thaumasiovibrio occultus TaxID=1891184 RepID=UPI000B351D0F|nr:FtsH protease activity modulator HflK [Thaumasiovibrio occultus]